MLIVGGGVIGSAAALFLARDCGARVTVFERDPSYRRASSALSASSIRQQFSTAINIRLSQASFAFYRRIGEELAVGAERPDIGLTERGYLYLATAAGRATLAAKHAVQRGCDADVALLSPAELQARFPWLATADLAAGSLGLSGEGWFDGYGVLQAFRRKAIALGASYIAAEVREVACLGARAVAVTADGRRFDGDVLLLAAGAWSAPLARQLGFELPVAARKRDVFAFTAPVELPHCPLVIDPSGVWFRPEGRGFICGAPPRGADRDDVPLQDIDHGLFDEFIWPRLAARVPAFEALRVTGAWAGYYEFNTFDQNGIVGALPGCDHAFVACGFSGHGIQQAPAVGRGIAELIATGEYRTLDLSALAPARIARGEPVVESNVI
ncbi:MAG TPA: FAD-binding oxidoreductase [Burkholderiaceae bacterium]|nr:FAD-binding oxidoreductase [Burkholderiaceae bacterium]